MDTNRTGFIRMKLIFLAAIVLIFAVSIATAQQSSTAAAAQQEEVAVVKTPAEKSAASNVPVFKDYRGVRIGMTAEEVRSTLEGLNKDTSQDFLALSEKESAQIYYDEKGNVTAVSIDYFGGDSNAPSPEVVLGAPVQAKPDGSIYQLNRYPEAGYWVSYNRTAGDKPIVTITMQKM